ncbi:FtsK/SpoIIIE domain-containing protein [Nocardiopsis trehalosi]|uniref:FtsK/SpoIIIE domain-containing protein n=1 Tax=Nocardiopsis trehalosi TaxID=109329 RepID=UPI00082A9C7D|nr:FtsK/SpoIIIE domain-containing protein [Nocardiopsis trehalosi]
MTDRDVRREPAPEPATDDETVVLTREGGRVVPFRGRADPMPGRAEGAAGDRHGTGTAPGGGVVVGPVLDGELVSDGRPVPDGEGPVPLLPVDRADVLTDTGTWLEQRHARYAERPPIVPPVLRDRHAAAEEAQFLVRYFAHAGAWHATRSPVYLLRLLGRSPRGMARLAGRWAAWVADAEARPVHAKAAAAGDPQAWLLLSREHSRRVRPRRIASAAVAVPAAALIVAASLALPAWAVGAFGAGVLALFGLAGGQADRPLIERYVTAHALKPLDSDEVTASLAAIGIKGALRFAHPIQTDGPGWRAEVDLPPGVLAEEVLEKRARLAGAMRRPLSTVWPETDRDTHPGRLVLWVAKTDPAKAKRRLWPLLRDGQADLFGEVPFGFDPRGRPVAVSLMGTNVLIGGVMGSGKTSAVLVLALAGALDPTCELWVYEMKGSGDVEAVKPVCHRYMSGDDDADCASALMGLYALEKELKRRKKLISELPLSEVPNGRKVYPHLAARRELRLHPILAIYDEAHTLFEHEEFGKEAAAVAERLIKKARAYGIVLVLTTQRPDASSIPKGVSDNAILRFCLAVTGHVANDLVLGTSMYKRGVRATMFDPQRDAGTGWLARSALNAQIVRAAFITQQEAADVARRALALRTAAGTLSGQAAGQAVEDVDTSTIVDHLVAVWPAGEEAMHSRDLVGALAAYRPEVYGAWLEIEGKDETDTEAKRSAQLAAALRPHGVLTHQVNRRGSGGNRKGVRWDDLQRAAGVGGD